MFSTPTDRLHKFAAVGGLALALAGGSGALNQYHETAMQNAEFYGKTQEVLAVYNRFAKQAREQIDRSEKLKDANLTEEERNELHQESKLFQDRVPAFDKEFEEAAAAALKQHAVTSHYYTMQAIWLVLAVCAIAFGVVISYRGFKVWLKQPSSQR